MSRFLDSLQFAPVMAEVIMFTILIAGVAAAVSFTLGLILGIRLERQSQELFEDFTDGETHR